MTLHATKRQLVSEIVCPCCKQPTSAPTLDVVILKCQLPRQQARILEAIWNGKGFPVSHSTIYAAMYYDDPNGEPSDAEMYRTMKTKISQMRVKLNEIGINIVSQGWGGRRYQLSLAG